jgi:CRP/FNR family transcriptional regulator, cyclic AMP receptor protein
VVVTSAPYCEVIISSEKLAPQHIDRLSACIVTMMAKRGTNIFLKGDPGSCLCAIGAGEVKIGAPLKDGKNGMYNVLRKGDVFGEVALLDGSPRTADAVAVTDCELYWSIVGILCG